jgi:hypothetical protein
MPDTSNRLAERASGDDCARIDRGRPAAPRRSAPARLDATRTATSRLTTPRRTDFPDELLETEAAAFEDQGTITPAGRTGSVCVMQNAEHGRCCCCADEGGQEAKGADSDAESTGAAEAEAKQAVPLGVLVRRRRRSGSSQR